MLDAKPTRRLLDLIYTALLALRCSLFLLPWLAHLFVADLILSALLPLAALRPTAAYNLASFVAEWVWRGIQFIFTHINGANILISGAESLPPGESAIVVSNHVEWTDFYLIQQLALDAGMLGRCRWFAKQQLKWVPFLGWGLWAMGMPLVSRKWMEDKRQMERVFKGVLEHRWPMWLISYSEATRFSSSKRREAEAYCAANSKPLGPHTLYPRTKGFVACVQALRHAPHVKAVYDVTIGYARIRNFAHVDDGQSWAYKGLNGNTTHLANGAHKHYKSSTEDVGYRTKHSQNCNCPSSVHAPNYDFQQPPTFLQTLLTPSLHREYKFLVHVDRYPLADLPEEDTDLVRWLEQRWVEKGQRLEAWRSEMEGW